MVDSILPTAPGSSAPLPQPGSGALSGGDALSSDFETFLKMLTVQVENQDPLNPVDSTDYATQLATFSSVEQQVLTNDLLRAMADNLGGSSLQSMSNLVGMQALARAPVYFDQTSTVAIRPEIATGADSAELVVRDASGALVQRFAIPDGQDTVLWAGADDTGALLPAGVYRFEIESYTDGVLIDTSVAPAYSRIDEVRSEGGEILVRLSDGTEIPQSLITGLRQPE